MDNRRIGGGNYNHYANFRSVTLDTEKRWEQRWRTQTQQTKFLHLDIRRKHWRCEWVLVSGSTVTVRLSLWNKDHVWGLVNCERFSAAYVGRRVTQWLIKPVDFHLADCSVCRSSWPTLQGKIRPGHPAPPATHPPPPSSLRLPPAPSGSLPALHVWTPYIACNSFFWFSLSLFSWLPLRKVLYT